MQKNEKTFPRWSPQQLEMVWGQKPSINNFNLNMQKQIFMIVSCLTRLTDDIYEQIIVMHAFF